MRFVSILFCLPQNSHFTFKINSSSRNEIFLLHSVCGLTSDYTSEAGNKCSGGATGAAQHVTDKWLVSRHQSAYPGWDRIHVGAGIYWAGTSLWFHWLLHAACREKKSVLHIATSIQKHNDGRSTQIFYSSESIYTAVQKHPVSSTISLKVYKF